MSSFSCAGNGCGKQTDGRRREEEGGWLKAEAELEGWEDGGGREWLRRLGNGSRRQRCEADGQLGVGAHIVGAGR